jgi:hypothetical protein
MIYRRVSIVCALLTCALGALTLVGWVAGIEALASIRRNYIPMAPSTALGFAILGTIMLLRQGRLLPRRVADILLLVVAIVAAAKLFELVSGASLGLDELLVADPAMFGAVKKGRMSPITALNFLLMCTAIFTLLRDGWRTWAGWIAVAGIGINFVVVLGYLHGSPLLYGGRFVPVALPTALAFFLLGVSVIAAAGPAEWPLRSWIGHSARAVLLRWFLPPVAVLALVSGLVRTKFVTDWGLNPALSSALATLF